MIDMAPFVNREHAAHLLCEKIRNENIEADLIMALPRGGVPVGNIMAMKMKIPLRLILIRKIGHPNNPEYAIGAVSETDVVMNDASHYGTEYLKKEIVKERKRIVEMQKIFNHQYQNQDISGKRILLTDDGIATGTCMELALKELKENGASSVKIAVPVCPYNTYQKLIKKSDGMICILVAQNFLGIGSYYDDFRQLTDEMVISILDKKKLPEQVA
jgi:putative phosphoribosyl transferase